MPIVEYIIPANQKNINHEIDMSSVNDCIVHGCKPNFIRSTAKRNKKNIMMVVRCKTDNCMRCCDGYYEKEPVKEIVQIWNKWNPITAPNDERSVATDLQSE